MPEGSLGTNGTATVTLDDRVAQVIVTAEGGELWVTTDGSNPDYPKASTVRVIPSRSPQAISVSSFADPTVVKLRSPKGADYTVTAGTQTDADSAEGMGATPEQSGASVAWDAVEEATISLTATTGDLSLVSTDQQITITSASDLQLAAADGITVVADSGGVYLESDGSNFVDVSPAGVAIDGVALSFFGATAVAKPTGVAVTAEAIHAALVALGLIAGP